MPGMVSVATALVAASASGLFRLVRKTPILDVASRTLFSLPKDRPVFSLKNGNFELLKEPPKGPMIICKRALVQSDRKDSDDVCSDLMIFYASEGIRIVQQGGTPKEDCFGNVHIYAGRRWVGTLASHDELVRQALCSGHYRIIATLSTVKVQVYSD